MIHGVSAGILGASHRDPVIPCLIRPNDCVVGQLLRCMSYVKDEIAEVGQEVHGVVIGLEDDLRLRRAL